MSAAPVSPDFAGGPGFLCLLRGRQWDGYSPSKHGPLWNYRLLPSRAGDAGALLFMFIYDFTWSAFGSPEWAKIALETFCQYFPHKSPRAIRYILDFLVSIHLIERDPDDPWRFKTHPENVATAPLLTPVRHPEAAAKKRLARTAGQSAPGSVAALRNERTGNKSTVPPNTESFSSGEVGPGTVETCFTPAGEPPEIRMVGPSVGELIQITPTVGNCPSNVKPISISDGTPTLKSVSLPMTSVSEEGQTVSLQREMQDRARETYCPWDWGCPFIVSDMAAHKPLSLITESLQAARREPCVKPEIDRTLTRGDRDQIRKLLLDELGDKFPGEDLGDFLCEQVFRALNGAPIEWVTEGSRGIGLLRHLVRKKSSEFESYGLARVLAERVGKCWQERRLKDCQKEEEQRSWTVRRLTAQAKESFSTLHETWQSLNQLTHAVT
jgi:hypothetical protein